MTDDDDDDENDDENENEDVYDDKDYTMMGKTDTKKALSI